MQQAPDSHPPMESHTKSTRLAIGTTVSKPGDVQAAESFPSFCGDVASCCAPTGRQLPHRVRHAAGQQRNQQELQKEQRPPVPLLAHIDVVKECVAVNPC